METKHNFKIGDKVQIIKITGIEAESLINQIAEVYKINSNILYLKFLNKDLKVIKKYGNIGWMFSSEFVKPYKPKLKKFLEEFKSNNCQ